MKRSALLLVPALLGAALLLPGAPAARAAEITLESRTYVPASEDGADGLHVTGYEYLDFGVEDLGLPGLFVRAGGWGSLDFAEETRGKSSDGDLQYGYVGYRAPRRNTEGRLGRLSVTAGAARNEVFDGLQLSSDLGAGFDVLAYGGIPVETDAAGRSGDSIWGGRLSQGRLGLYAAGLSYLAEEDDAKPAREEAAADLWWRPWTSVTLSGNSLYNADSGDFARHDWRVALDPLLLGASITARYSWTDYAAYFTAADAKAFVFPAIDPAEKLESMGADLEVPLRGGFALGIDYTALRYEIAEPNDRYGARFEWEGGRYGAGFGYHRSSSDAAASRYVEYSGWGSMHISAARLALGVQEVRFDEEINGRRDAFSATLAADAGLTRTLSAGADVEYASNPDYQSQVRGMLRLTWRFSATTGAKGGTTR